MLALTTRACVSVPITRTAAARPMAMTRNGPPKPELWANRASTTSDAEATVRWMVIRLMISAHAMLRVASRLQCSVARIWALTPAGTASGGGALLPTGSASAARGVAVCAAGGISDDGIDMAAPSARPPNRIAGSDVEQVPVRGRHADGWGDVTHGDSPSSG